jgi:uncharacterized repeat protein (TIGR03803 family)
LIRDAEGNFYGTTGFGGYFGGDCSWSGCGTIFMLDKAGKFSVLYRFHRSDGAGLYGGVVRDAAGNLYGATCGGGNESCPGGGCGTIFRLSKTGKGTVYTALQAERMERI